MFSLSFKLSTAVPALLSAFSKTKALTTFADSTSNTPPDSSSAAYKKRTPTRPRVTVHEIMMRFAKSHPETSSPSPPPTRDIPVSEPPCFRMPTRRTANSRATAMDVAAMFDEAHVDKPSTVRGTEVKNALSRIIANASQ